MKILYGVMGEGMGHAMRSLVVIEHLLAQGHTLEIMASSRARDFLAAQFQDLPVNRIRGLHLIYRDNRVVRSKTLWSNLQQGLAGVPRNVAAYFKLIEGFRPEAVISDFESWVYLYGLSHGLPILSLDNMHVMTRCTLPEAVLRPIGDNFRVTKAFVKGKLPFCSHYVVSSIFKPELRKPNTTLVPPLLRRGLLAASPKTGSHMLVYQTSESHDELVATLIESGIECRVYGLRRGIREDQKERNLCFRPFDERAFVEDLASARGVIAGGGFTLMGEAVYLRKPMLAVPIRGQFEQVLNARYLEHTGYGMSAESVSASVLRRFTREMPRFVERLSSYRQEGNREAFAAVDTFLARV